MQAFSGELQSSIWRSSLFVQQGEAFFMRCLVTFAALMTLSFAPQLLAQDAKPDLAAMLHIETDIEYGKAGERSLVLDMVRPESESATPRPVVVYVHGGGWRGGSKNGMVKGPMAIMALTENYVGVSVGYRLSGEAIWPAQIHDCKAAIRFLKAHAKKYHIDPNKIAVWGTSAGGHLVSLLGTSGDIKDLDGANGSPDADTRVACVINFCGPSDFFTFAKTNPQFGGPAETSVVRLLFGGPADEKKVEATAASPITHISAGDPPFLIVHGTADTVVDVSQAEQLHTALEKAGVSSTLVKIEGGGHSFGGPEVVARTKAFLDKHLKGKDVEVSSEPIPAPTAKKAA